MTQTDVEQIVLPDDPSFGTEVQVDYPGYRSTLWRAPDRPLVTLPEEFHRLDGPVFGEDAIGELDNDLTRQHEGEPLGERIVVTGRVVDDNGRAIPNALVEVWQANAGGRYKPRGRPAPRAARPELLRRRPHAHRLRGQLALRHDQARRLPWGNHENAWRPQHIHFSVFGRAFTQRLVTQMYFPGDPLIEHDPIFHRSATRRRAR